jgi:hypothetical protein
VGFLQRASSWVRPPATVAAFAALLMVQTAPAAAPSASPATCRFPDSEVSWLQRALDGWDQVSREFLATEPAELPWIVLFDGSCVWHLAGEAPTWIQAQPIATDLTFRGAAVPVRAQTHDGTLFLPSGAPMSVEMKASTSLYRNGRAAFFVMAMPSVWQTRDVSAPTRAEFLQGVFSHEMTHIRLIVPISRLVNDLVRKNDLAYPINDDQIQRDFQRVHGFAAAFSRERDLFYRAALDPDPGRRRELTRAALKLVRDRHARFFTGANAAYAEIESLFLTMEGVGQWAAYRLNKARAGGNEGEALRLVRENKRYWSQDEGLALFLLIDALVPGWQSRIFTDSPASPFTLLQEAVDRPSRPLP